MRRLEKLGAALLICLPLACLLPCGVAAAQASLDELERRLEDLPEPAGRPREPGYLGLVADDAPLAGGGLLGEGLPGGGVRVTAVYAGSPAADAGIQPGDLITVIGGAEIRNLDDMARVLAAYDIGKSIDVELRRGLRKITAHAKLTRRPGTTAPPLVIEARPSLGVVVVPLTPEARTRFGLTVASGALVDSVRPGSPAAEAGVLPGAAIVALDGRRIDAPNELAANVAALRVGQEVEVAYYVGDTLYRKRTMLTAATADPLAPERRETAKPLAPGAPAPGALPPNPLAPSEELSELKRELTLLQSQAEAMQRRIAALEARLAEEKE